MVRSPGPTPPADPRGEDAASSSPAPEGLAADLPPGAPPVRHVHEIGNRTYLVADVEPLDVTGVRTVGFGTLAFLGAFLGLLPSYGWLVDTDRQWWLWTCAVGFGLGLFGLWFCVRRARHLAPDGPGVAEHS